MWFSIGFFIWLFRWVGFSFYWFWFGFGLIMVGSAGLRWWCLAVLSCGDVGGGAGSVWLALGGCRCVVGTGAKLW